MQAFAAKATPAWARACREQVHHPGRSTQWRGPVIRPFQDKLREDEPTINFLDCRRKALRQRIRVIREQRRAFLFVEPAKRQNAGQQCGALVYRAGELHRERPSGALRRHIDRDARKLERRAVARDSGDYLAVQQGGYKCREVRNTRRDIEDIASHDDSSLRSSHFRHDKRLGARRAFSASAMAATVPTCSQSPCARRRTTDLVWLH